MLHTLILVSALLAGSSRAATEGTSRQIRALRPEAASLVRDAAACSATVRRLLNEIAATDVVVYVEVALNPAVPLARTVLMNSAGKGRYMLVSLNPDFDEPTRIGLFAHELQHVIEIAAHPWVTDPASLRRLYQHIASNPDAEDRFETDVAERTGRLVWREVTESHAARRQFGPDSAC